MSERKIPEQYLPKTLSKADRAKQKKSILEGTDRPKVKFQSTRSKYVKAFQKKYGTNITDDTFIDKNIITKTGINKILKKGMGAYYTSGSRPNQTAQSWARARLASVIMNGPARRVDEKIWNKHKR